MADKKYLDSTGLQEYTKLVKGKMNTMQENLQEQIDKINVMASNLKLAGSVSPSIIQRDVESTVTVTATVSGTFENSDVTSIKVLTKDVNGVKSASDSEKVTLSDADQSKTPSKTYSVTATVKGAPLTASTTVYAYYPIYYCATADFTNAGSLTVDENSIDHIPTNASSFVKSTSKQNYGVTCPASSNNLSKFMLFVPVAVTQHTVFKYSEKGLGDTSGFGAPLSVCTKTINGIQYKVYYSGGTTTYNDGKTFYINAA